MATQTSAGKNKSPLLATVHELPTTYTDVIPPPPPTLKATGQRRWYQVAALMVNRKCWSLDWVPALESMCRSWDMLSVIDLEMAKPETRLLVPGSGNTVKPNPLLHERHRYETFLQAQLMQFGLTPLASRGAYMPLDLVNNGKGSSQSRVPSRNKDETIFEGE